MTGTISRSQIQKLFNQNEAYLSLIIVAYSILVTSLNPSFIFENLLDLGKSSASLGILAIGVLSFSSLVALICPLLQSPYPASTLQPTF